MNPKPCRKALVRDCEVNKAEKPKVKLVCEEKQRESQLDKLLKAYQLKTDKKMRFQTRQNDLVKPVLNSGLSIARRFKQVKSTKSLPAASSSKDDKGLLEIDVTKKLNFPPEQHLYKDLVKLNISDSSSSNEYNIPLSGKPTFRKLKKDPIQQIEDFSEPKPKNFVTPEVETFENPPLKPYRIFDMSYTQRTLKKSD